MILNPPHRSYFSNHAHGHVPSHVEHSTPLTRNLRHLAPTFVALKNACHDYHGMPDRDPFMMPLKCLNSIQPVGC